VSTAGLVRARVADTSLLGRLAVELKKITPAQLDECVAEQRENPSLQLGSVMVKKGYLDFATLLLLLKLQDKKLGERSRHSSLRKRDNLFGRVAVEYGFCTQEQMNEALRLQAEKPDPDRQLGELLIERGVLRREDVQLILEIQDKKVLLCTSCRTQYNVAGHRPGQPFVCKRCGATMNVAGKAEHREGFKHGTTIIGLSDKKGAAGAGARRSLNALPTRAGSAGAAAGHMTSTAALAPAACAGIASGAGAADAAPGTADAASTRSVATPAGAEDEGQARARVARWELIAELGNGRHSTIYKAWDRQARKTVTVKVLDGEIGAPEIELFRKAAEATRPLDHPRLTRLLEYGDERGFLYVVSEYVEGQTLRAVLPEVRAKLDRILDVWIQMAEGIAHAHERGVLHRDLKPENVLVEAGGAVKVTDFGIAVQMGSAADEDDAGQKIVLGTAPYMAPEQAAGDLARHGPHSDVYGLGAVAYELYTGRPPHTADTLPALLDKVQFGEIVPVRKLRPEVPAAVEAVVLRCLARDPARRYPDARSLLADLRRLAAGERPEATATLSGLTPKQIAWTVVAAILAAGALLFAMQWLGA